MNWAKHRHATRDASRICFIFRGAKATRAEHCLGGRLRIVSSRQASKRVVHESYLAAWAESFLFAGGSALLLLSANLLVDYWYLSFFALTPFLYKIIKASPGESLRLGFLLGLSFFGASFYHAPAVSAFGSLFRLIFGTVLCALFAWSVGKARQRWGFNPSMVALLWVGLQMALIKFGYAGGLLGNAGFSQPFLQSLIGLFGFLAASALVVFFNSLLVLAIVNAIQARRAWGKKPETPKQVWNHLVAAHPLTERVYIIPEERAPPCALAKRAS
jgi:hypothetical protein